MRGTYIVRKYFKGVSREFDEFRVNTHVCVCLPAALFILGIFYIFDLQDSLDKLMHFLPQLSDFVPLRNGYYSFRAQTS